MKNEYEIRGDVTAIIISSPMHGRKEVLISTSSLDRAKEFPNSWYAHLSKGKIFYVYGNMPRNKSGRVTAYLHRWITHAPDDLDVDHINHDTLNNTKENLRILTKAENNQNINGAYKNNKTSGLRGITWNKHTGKWQAYISVNGKRNNLGQFIQIEEAERAVMEARAKYMPFSREAS